MASDPVRQTTEQSFEMPFVDDLPKTLLKLASLPPSVDPPYLTLMLDLRPEGTQPNRRPGLDFLKQNRDEFLAGFAAHSPAHESLAADLERIDGYLEDELDEAMQGLVFVACSGVSVFEPVPLGFPLPNRIVTAPTPALRALAHTAEDQPTYAVLLADQREATLSLIDQARRRVSVAAESASSARGNVKSEGSPGRYQNRGEEKLEAFARGVAEETRTTLDDAGVRTLVLAGDEQIVTVLTDALHQSIRDHVVGSVRLAIPANAKETIEATLPIVEQAERDREAAAVGAIREGAGPGGRAVTGAVDTLTALQTGQAMTLVMNDDFAAPGWADYTYPVYGVGEVPAEHPAGGDPSNLTAVALDEELVRLALQVGAEIEVVRSSVPVGAAELAATPEADDPTPRAAAARELDGLGGVGATLRYTLESDQSTADM